MDVVGLYVNSPDHALVLAVDEKSQIQAPAAEQPRSEQLGSTITSVERQIVATRTKNISDVLSQVDDLRRQRDSLGQELAKIRDIGSKTRLSLAKNALMVDGTLTQLLPGMGVTAEIPTG